MQIKNMKFTIKFCLIWCSIFFVLLINPVFGANKTAKDFYLEGRKYYTQFSEEGYIKAIKSYKEALKIDPDYALAMVGISESSSLLVRYQRYNYSELFERARKYSEMALKLSPNLPEAYRASGLYSWENYHAPEGSIPGHPTNSEMAVKLMPLDAEANYVLWLNRGRKTDNELIYRAIKLNPHFVLFYKELGDAFLEEGRIEDAEEQYKQAVKIHPEYLEAQLALAKLYYPEFPEEAENKIKYILKLNSNFYQVFILKSEHYRNKNDLDNAYKECVNAFKANNNKYNESIKDCFYKLAGKYFDKKESDKSIYIYKQLLTFYHDDAIIENSLGYVYLKKEDLNNAIIQLNKAIKDGEHFHHKTWSASIHYNLACAYALNKDINKLLIHLKEAIKAGNQYKDYAKDGFEFNDFKNNPDFIEITK